MIPLKKCMSLLKVFKGEIYYQNMPFYSGLPKEKVLEIYSFVMKKRKEKKYGQRTLSKLVKENFDIDFNESTISGWIFRKVVPYSNEKTQFKQKAIPDKKELFYKYFIEMISPDEIAKTYKVTDNTVRKWILEYGGKTRTLLDSMNSYKTKLKLREKRLRRPSKNFEKVTEDKAYIFGVLCGDGHINSKYIRFEIRSDEEFVKEFSRCLESVYGIKYNYKYYAPRNSFVLYVASVIICKEILKKGSFMTHEWKVPVEIIKCNNKKIIGNFLRGYYDSEGSVSRSVISVSSINLEGLKQIQKLLGKLGIKSTFRLTKNRKYGILSIFRKQRFKIFLEKIGFTILRKQERLREILKNDRFYKEA